MVLEDGRSGDYAWSVKVRRSSEPVAARGRRAPRGCLLVGIKRQFGPFSFQRSKLRACAHPVRRTAPTGPPLVATGVLVDGGGKQGLTAVGILTAPAVRRVVVSLAQGRRETIPLKKPPTDWVRKAGLARFRFAAFAVRGPWSVERLVSQGAAGRTLWESDAGATAFGQDAVHSPR